MLKSQRDFDELRRKAERRAKALKDVIGSSWHRVTKVHPITLYLTYSTRADGEFTPLLYTKEELDQYEEAGHKMIE